MAAEEVEAVHRAGLVHDLGRVGVPNSVWDKPAALTRGERDKVQSHTLLTEQLLRNCAALAAIEPVASAHHERLDGSGYHRRCTGAQLSKAARLVAAADCYQAMTEGRAHRSARLPDEAAAEVREMARTGALDPTPSTRSSPRRGTGSAAAVQRCLPASRLAKWRSSGSSPAG